MIYAPLLCYSDNEPDGAALRDLFHWFPLLRRTAIIQLKSRKPVFTASYVRINRLTSKVSVLSEERFAEEVGKEKALREEIFLVMGVIVINHEPYLVIVREVEPVATLNTEKVLCIKKVEYIPFKHKFLYRSVNQAENEKIL